ncbi:claudin-4-like [Pangasianodon hypophthalmus]|uniref:claudin-4-like n=1 Tax=Pangasianodon hypophthalmus TaxID=310915 RepID=UPI000EFE9CB1|nr:claudin-4-like [Pangasianodon hypophthalmus]
MERWHRVFEQASFGVAFSGWIFAIFTRTLPVWIVTGAVDNTTDTLSLYWDGIWLNWQEPRIGDLHCHFYQSLLSLAGHFNSWKVSVNVLIGVGVIPIVLYIVAVTMFPQKVRIKAAAGFVFVLSGLLMLVIVSWITHATNSDLDTSIPLKRDWGTALYSGWVGMVLLLIGGGVLSTSWFKAPPEPEEQIRTTQEAAMPEAEDPLFARHHAAFFPSPYRQTTRPI